MKNEKEYDDIISNIRAAEPILDNGNVLTAGIMGRIEAISASENRRRRLLSASMVSATAAAILLGLLVSEISVPSEIPPTASANYAAVGKYITGYEGMSKDEIAASIYERRERLAAITQAIRLRSEKHYE